MHIAEKTWSSYQDFQQCTRDFGVELEPATGRVRLLKSVLVADETGRTIYRKAEELSRFVWARKELLLDSVTADDALLMFFAYEHTGNQLPMIVEVNGQTLEYLPDTPMQGWFLWRYLPIPTDWLVTGRNEIVLRTDAVAFNAWNLAVENANLTGRSAKSTDQGQTWDYALQGYDFSLKGEYVVRLRLGRCAPAGALASPQVDLADFAGTGIGLKRLPDEVCLTWEADEPPATEVAIAVRHGRLPLQAGEARWSAWQPMRAGQPLDTGDARFLQWRATLSTGQACVSPSLDCVRLEARRRGVVSELPKMRLVAADNPPIKVSSFPFTYQAPEEPRLQVLREQEALEVVVAGAQSEWEKFIVLREWTARQWRAHEGVDICPYDALVILDWKRNARRQKQGGCMHFAAVYAQCCLALGMQARFVACSENITLHDGGHFVCEVWSNDYRKWVVMDPDLDIHFEADGLPLSALEIHRLWATGQVERIREVPGRSAAEAQFAGHGLAWVKSGHFHFWGIVPRNNQLTAQMPYHIEHGQVTYHQNYFVWWGDFILSDLPHFDNFSSRPDDFDWTLNLTHIYLQKRPDGDLWVELETVTPHFDRYEMWLDNSRWAPTAPAFAWKMEPGSHRLEVRAVNAFDLPGPSSWVEVEKQA